MATDVVQTIVDWIGMLPAFWVYAVFFAICYLENVVPPIPGDVLLAFGGYLAAAGLLSGGWLWLLSVVASVIGFMNMYWLGKKLGDHIDQHGEGHFLMRFIDYRYFRKARMWMYRYGYGVILANRFLAGTRTVISFTAGGAGLRAGWTSLNAFISSALWNFILIGAGWLVRDNWLVIGDYLSVYGQAILGILALIIAGRIFWVYKYRNKHDNSNANE